MLGKLKVQAALKTLFKVVFASALIYWMINKGVLDFGLIMGLASPALVSFCLFCVFLQIFVNNYRWVLLMRGQGIPSSIRHSLPLSYIGMFFNFVMPGGVGGDVIKGYYLLQDFPQQKYGGAVSVFMDRMIGMFIMIVTAFVAMFFNWSRVVESRELQSVALAVAAFFFAFIGFFTLALSRRMGRTVLDTWLGELIFVKLPGGSKIRRIYDAVHAYRQHPKFFFWSCVLSLGNQILMVAFTVAIGWAMGVRDLPLETYFFLVPVGTVVTALPISPAGIGVGQAAFYFLFSLYLGKQNQLGTTSVTVMQVANFAFGIVGAFIYLARKKPELKA
jgi:glycosyltransferase 2 family protein